MKNTFRGRTRSTRLPWPAGRGEKFPRAGTNSLLTLTPSKRMVMPHRISIWTTLLLLLAFSSCETLFPRKTRGQVPADDGRLDAIFIQVNDVYEIAPLSNGKSGGLARIAALKKQYQALNPNTYLFMAGDFLSPSVFNSLQYQGKPIRGRQMVEAMNAAGFDLVTFGNHEFDIKEKELTDRINESRFSWVSSNCFHRQKGVSTAFEKTQGGKTEFIPRVYYLSMQDADGTRVKVGIISVTLPSNKAEYVGYVDALSTIKKFYGDIKDSCDAVVALTHQSVEADSEMVRKVPGLALVMGGHEHDMRFKKVDNVYITKAHANARTAFILRLSFDKKTRKVTVLPELKKLDEAVALDSATNAVVNRWSAIADSSYGTLGFNARQIVLASGDSLDGRESEVRYRSTALTRLITDAMSFACPKADAVLLNSGSIRVDDIMYPPISQFDILRALPFGGPIREVDMKGRLLLQVLEAGARNQGNGGFLQDGRVQFNSVTNTWMVGGHALDIRETYRVALSDFLLTGRETNLGFLNPQNPELVKVYDTPTAPEDTRSDIRLALVRFLQWKGGPPTQK
jgi:5'-nucleotidase